MERLRKIILSIAAITAGVFILSIAAGSLFGNKKIISNIVQTKNPTPISLPQTHTVAAWIWKYPTELENEISTLASRSKDEDINTFYVYIDEYIDIYEMKDSPEKKQKLESYTSSLEKILSEAKANNIKVHALSGSPSMSYDSHDYIPPLLIDHVFDFNSTHPDLKIKGVQFDIEFYDDKRFFGDREEYAKNYVALVSKLKDQTKNLNEKNNQNVALGFVIPFWFDEPNEYTSIPITKQLIDILSTLPNSYLVLMSYRNQIEGQGGVLDISKGELEAAGSVKIIIGQELVQNKETKITHYGKSRNEIKTDLTKLIELAKVYPSFEGISLHDLPAFLNAQ